MSKKVRNSNGGIMLSDDGSELATSIDRVGVYPLCDGNGVGEKIVLTEAATDYEGSALPGGTIGIAIKAPLAYDVLVNIGGDTVMSDDPLGIMGQWVLAGTLAVFPVAEDVDPDATVHIQCEAGGQAAYVTYLTK